MPHEIPEIPICSHGFLCLCVDHSLFIDVFLARGQFEFAAIGSVFPLRVVISRRRVADVHLVDEYRRLPTASGSGDFFSKAV